MARVSIVFGMLLCGLSAAGMIGSINKDPSQFIPMMFGIPVLFCGVVSLNPHRRRLAMRLAAILAFIGGITGVAFIVLRAVPQTPLQIELQRSALILMGCMILLCWTHAGLQLIAELQSRQPQENADFEGNMKLAKHEFPNDGQTHPTGDESHEVLSVQSSPDP